MSLYPQYDFEPPGLFEIPSGCLGVLPFTLTLGSALDIITAHLSPVQDHSLRAWISLRKGGVGLTFPPTSMWHLNRTPDEIVSVYEDSYTGPVRDGYAIRTQAGPLFLNILNLINLPNAFSVKIEALNGLSA